MRNFKGAGIRRLGVPTYRTIGWAALSVLLGSIAFTYLAGGNETRTGSSAGTGASNPRSNAATATPEARSRSIGSPFGAAPASGAAGPDAGEDAPVIVLNPAHDQTEPGALGIEYREVLTTALYTKAALEEAGYTVHLTRYNNDTILHHDPELLPANADDFHPGYARAYAYASKALQYDPDMVIVLHYNGFTDPEVAGPEVYYCELGGEQNLVLASIVLEELLVALRSLSYEPPRARVIEDMEVARGDRHFPSLGNVYEHPNTWVENRYAGIPVVLTEPLYLTNPTELALIEDPGAHIAFAEAYVRAIDLYFGR